MQVKILYHGRCFDGFSSAAVFARFARLHLGARGPLRLQGLSHGAPVPIAPSVFDADLHAIVDFRYSAHPRLDWWFDHHQTAFITAEERAVYEVRHGARHYWDPRAASCAGYMARMLSEHHGFDAAPLAELVRWVDLIDTARFPDARTAVALEAPQRPQHLVDQGRPGLLVELAQGVGEQVVEGRDQERVLVVDVPVDGGRGDAGGLGDARHRRLLEARLAEEARRRGDDLVLLLVAVAGASVARHTPTVS